MKRQGDFLVGRAEMRTKDMGMIEVDVRAHVSHVAMWASKPKSDRVYVKIGGSGFYVDVSVEKFDALMEVPKD